MCAAGNDLIGDLLVVAGNLGMHSKDGPRDRTWSPGEMQEFKTADGTIIVRATGHLNGALHLKVNIDLLRKINVEFGRLKGWLRDWREAAHETGISGAEAESAWESNVRMLPRVEQLTG